MIDVIWFFCSLATGCAVRRIDSFIIRPLCGRRRRQKEDEHLLQKQRQRCVVRVQVRLMRIAVIGVMYRRQAVTKAGYFQMLATEFWLNNKYIRDRDSVVWEHHGP